MSSGFIFYSLAYFFLSYCIVYPPNEFVSAGLTIKNIIAFFLGSESKSFIQYHMKNCIATLHVYALIPFGYLLGLVLTGNADSVQVILGDENSWSLLLTTLVLSTLVGPLFSLYKAIQWSSNNWSLHPIAKSLKIYCNNNTSWQAVAVDINREFQSIDKIIIETNNITKIVATDNWIIKVTPYKLYFAHQSDTTLIVNKSDTHAFSPNTRGEVQYVNIQVNTTRPGAQSFNIRINVLDFKDLQDKVIRPIAVLNNVVFHKTLTDRFIDTFKELIAHNAKYETVQELEQCVGCMQATSNIKLNKLCNDSDERSESCISCYCRPMWCADCMAKWFASRQDETTPETWLSSKCTCPVCRAKFCMLDVSYVKTINS